MATNAKASRASLRDFTVLRKNILQQAYRLIQVTINSVGGLNSAVNPETVTKVLSGISSALTTVGTLAASNEYTSALAPVLKYAGTGLNLVGNAAPSISEGISSAVNIAEKGMKNMSFVDEMEIDPKDVSQAQKNIIDTGAKAAKKARNVFAQLKLSVQDFKEEGQKKNEPDNNKADKLTGPVPGS